MLKIFMAHIFSENEKKQMKVKISTGDWSIETLMFTLRLRNIYAITDSLDVGHRDSSVGKGACCHD